MLRREVLSLLEQARRDKFVVIIDVRAVTNFFLASSDVSATRWKLTWNW